ncbi:MAG: hypothetical protein KKH91_02730 [Elusimicrobia bacterium]|nr:hypothetical protein [Elusimicrobiota bacterium]MBU2614832.1 hypothetical protein [Elusimicrobiota bacterium]
MFKKIVLQVIALLFVASITGAAGAAGTAVKAKTTESPASPVVKETNEKPSKKSATMKATGYDVTYNALSFKNIKSDSKSTQYLLCVNYETAPKGTDKSLLAYVLGIRGRNKIYSNNNFRIDKMCGLVIVKNDTHFNINTNGMDIRFEFGAIPELFITESLSVEIPLGASIVAYGESFSNAGNGRTQITTFGSGATLAGVTFHYYFGK